MLEPDGTVVYVVVARAVGTSLNGQPLAGVDVLFNASVSTSEIFLTNNLHRGSR
jgi:hypothetical protein